MNLWFVRHGESEATAMRDKAPAEHNLPLTELGRSEALGVRDYFVVNKVPLTVVYSSSYVRAIETAEPTALQFGLAIEVRPDLRERLWGSMGALTWQQALERLSGMSIEERYNYSPDGGESWKQMEERSMRVIKEILNGETGDVAVFTHGGVLRGLLTALAGVDKAQHEQFTMKTGGIARYDSESHTVEIVL